MGFNRRKLEVRAQEENQRRRTTYDKLKAERDRLVADLKAIYPCVEARLGELIGKIDKNDRETIFSTRMRCRWARSVFKMSSFSRVELSRGV